MLLKFKCSNFTSILDEIEFSLFAGTYKRHTNHLIPFDSKDVLRISAIYGNNGSGKSNFIGAFHSLKHFITEGPRDENTIIILPIFKLKKCDSLPTKFDIDFVKDKIRYSYKVGFLKDNIISESLSIIEDGIERSIFNRTLNDGVQKITLGEQSNKDLKEKLREEIYSEEVPHNNSFLKEGYVKKLSGFKSPFEWFQDDLNVDNEHNEYGNLPMIFLNNVSFLTKVIKMFKAANLGIDDIKVEESLLSDFKSLNSRVAGKIEEEFTEKNVESMDFNYNGNYYSAFIDDTTKEIKLAKLSTFHKSFDGTLIEFDYDEESNGVRRLISYLLPALFESLYNGKTIIIDEIESSFHPVLLKEVIKLYLDSPLNTNIGQLIFTTHEDHLLDLDLFRQDEIWFCEKGANGQSYLYSLSEFKPRFDKDIRKGYLDGQFSKIPFLSNPENLSL